MTNNYLGHIITLLHYMNYSKQDWLSFSPIQFSSWEHSQKHFDNIIHHAQVPDSLVVKCRVTAC